MKIRKSSTRKEYIARINRVLDYIRQNLDRKLGLNELADVAAFSPFHFHRLFKAFIGESINEYVNRLRLERAAHLLKYNPDTSITEIGLESGFSSSSHFARAFKQHFGCSATQFREDLISGRKQEEIDKNSKIRQPISKSGEDTPFVSLYDSNIGLSNLETRRGDNMQVDVKDLPGYRVAYVRVMDGYNSQKIAPAFQKVMKWATARDLVGPETLIIGVGLDNPEITPADKCRYDACLTVPKRTEGEGEVGVYDIPAGKYAVCHVEGDYARINEIMGMAWTDLMRDWFPDSGYQPDDRPCFEVYRETEEEMNAGIFKVDLCEPVKPL